MKDNHTTELDIDKTLLGQLIAEIQKFGGMDNAKASQFAKIILPHIDAYANEKVAEELEGLKKGLPKLIQTRAGRQSLINENYATARNATVVKFERQLNDRIAELRNRGKL